MSNAPPRVFISYTAEDLTPFADAAAEVLKLMQWTVIDHRFWPADEQKSVAVCRQMVESSDIVVVIVAHRYGWRPGPEQDCDGSRSITEMEYQWARKARKPVIPFLIKDDTEWDDQLYEARKNPASLDPLNRFKSELRSYVCLFFTKDVGHFNLVLSVNLNKAKARLDAGTDIDNMLNRPLQPAVGTALERTPLLPYLCDRSKQSRHTLRTLFDHLNVDSRRPMLYLVHGDASQAHGAFIERVQGVMLPRVLAELPGLREFRPVTVNRVEPDGDSSFAAEFRSELASKLRQPSLDSDDALITWLRDSKCRGLLVALDLRTLECPDPQGALHAVHEYLQKFPDLPGPLFLVVVICVKYEAMKATLGQRVRALFARGREPNELARDAVQALDVDGRGDLLAPVYALPELESVTPSDLDEWVNDHRSLFRSYIANEDLENMLGPTRRQPMDRVIKQLERLLEQQRERA